ncbi:prepilin-type cleavage/methylation domain-containing protein [Actinobacillus succinogenes]|uniref:Prepilin peptidase dependent protein D n=1 Tax=Actinobacillus succinogenes (strain ATCC 55618 / DSM 22257 / CCUG 43843 / 130Z) TaxID=339671 RepID=A6VLZ0_ACTSZ|nr:prepilin peptidase-dependent pilin [Actinobacillus succinogenes]ABR73987.1 prepilin peptidase dependent protein D [Actinobacillus succinogenes 130Z]PHI39572.1 prepilin-type cleavage/methylation domain-containing protein [Actinobacillus succinogenes]
MKTDRTFYRASFSVSGYKGFTLIELMIVIAIVAILATVAVPSYQNYTKKAAVSELLQASAPYRSEVELCVYNTGSVTNCTAGSNGIQNDNAGFGKYVDSVKVSGGVITVTGKGSLNDTSYTLTAGGDASKGVTWTTACKPDASIFPSGFCN